MGPSSLSVGLCSLRLEKVPQGSVRCKTTGSDASQSQTHGHVHTHTDNTHAHLQKWRVRQHAQELREVVSNLFVHGADQADLTHGAGAVGSLGVGALHLQEGTEEDGADAFNFN